MISTSKVTLPEFGNEAQIPQIPVSVYRARLDAAIERIERERLHFLVVYADREHCANLAYLTGLDPRFEEAILILDRYGRGQLLVGNECLGYLPDESLELKIELFQDLSLMGQSRSRSRTLKEIFADAGMSNGATIGCVGWKYYDSALSGNTRHASDLPSYIIDILRDITGDPHNVTNATPLFMDPTSGLRIANIEPEQIALFEFASTVTSMSTLAVMRRLREGVREDELEKYLESAGLPLTCHRMIGFGDKARRGLASPSARKAVLGDTYTAGYGIVGALTSRAGMIANGPQDLPDSLRDFYARFAANYFDVVTTWYESLRMGALGGDVVAAVNAKRDASLYDFAVNPGHYIHLEEWVHSPFTPNSTIPLQSGIALQMDIIPISKGPFCYSNAEDGVVLADESLRAKLASKYPTMWKRIQARREFMHSAIGIHLDESVLPLSNMPAYLPPYVLSIDQVFVNRSHT